MTFPSELNDFQMKKLRNEILDPWPKTSEEKMIRLVARGVGVG